MLRLILLALIPVSGCVTAYERDTERGIWPPVYDTTGTYYVVGWKERFVVQPVSSFGK